MDETLNNPAQEEEDSGFARALYDWLQALAVALVCIILIFVFVGRFIYVDGDSMNPTLWDKDMMVVQTLGYTPAQGDVVVPPNTLPTSAAPSSSGLSPWAARPWTSTTTPAPSPWTA